MHLVQFTLLASPNSEGASNGTNKMTGIVKRSIVVAGHKTSISLEDEFWNGLREIASARALALSSLVASIDQNRQYVNLSSCIRLFVLEYYQARSDASGLDGAM
jgi:predicted DNA-binding ribbon-helix-helix protein